MNEDNKQLNSDFPDIGGLMVSKLVVEEKVKPKFIYREKRTREGDSGWRIFAGNESEEYLEDPENVGIYHARHIIEIDPSLRNLLLSGIGSVYEREDEKSKWIKVDDFKLEDDFIVEQRIGETWKIKINNLFEREEDQKDELFYTTGDKSIRIAIWNLPDSRDELEREHKYKILYRDQSLSKTLMTYDFTNSKISKMGYKIKEHDSRREYEVIYGYSIIEKQLLQLAFYYDNEEDEEWAIDTWKSIELV